MTTSNARSINQWERCGHAMSTHVHHRARLSSTSASRKEIQAWSYGSVRSQPFDFERWTTPIRPRQTIIMVTSCNLTHCRAENDSYTMDSTWNQSGNRSMSVNIHKDLRMKPVEKRHCGYGQTGNTQTSDDWNGTRYLRHQTRGSSTLTIEHSLGTISRLKRHWDI